MRKVALPVLTSIEMGAYQVLETRIPTRAAVNESVALVRRTHAHAAGYANAVLRKLVTLKDTRALPHPHETYEDHLMTLDVMQKVRYDRAYMFKYSPRSGTKAYKMSDDVNEEAKKKRLMEIIELQQSISYEKNQQMIGSSEIVLIEGFSRKSDEIQ